jgi:hypothetical protein
MPISELLPSPVRVRLHTSQFIDGIASEIKADRPVGGIVVARVGDGTGDRRYYIVDGHARVDAHRAEGLVEVAVGEELVLGSVADVVAEHVKRNTTSSLNPLYVANAVAFLAKEGVADPYAAVPSLSEVMKRAVQLILGAYDAELRAMLQKYLMEKAAVFHDIEVLPHFFIAVYEACSGDLPPGKDERERKEEVQRRMRTLIENILGYLNLLRTQERFVFPTPDQVMGIAATLKQKKALSAPGGAAAQLRQPAARLAYGGEVGLAVESDDGGDDSNDDDGDNVTVAGGGGSGSGGGRSRTDGYAGTGTGVIFPDNNKSVVNCVHCGKQQVIDLSTGAACRIEEFGPVRVIRDDSNGGGQPVFCLSPRQAEFLGLVSGAVDVDDVKQLVTDRKSEVERFLKKVSIATRFVVIAVDHEE